MQLYSTKRLSPDVDLKEAVLKGLPSDNGLYMPYEMFHLPSTFFDELPNMSYNEMAQKITQHIVGSDISESDIEKIINEAYDFDAPLVDLGDIKILELFQGPTLAFKDFGARFMGRLMGHFLQGSEKEVNILVATSGDTGSAVAHGFLNVEGIKVTILYPKGKVSDIQEKQFTTLGANITALEIDGTFDDCQRLVKTAFLDKELNEKLVLSSANSINIARLIPQSFYYFWAYKQLADKSLPLYFSIPSGNFGNLTACLFAQAMGLPIQKIIAATNDNNIVPDYLESGIFQPRSSVSTISNAMDVGDPSNFARIMDIYANDWEVIKDDILGYHYNDEQTAKCLQEVYQEHNYLVCPHTAVGYLAMKDFLKSHPEPSNAIVLSTAHPVKFGEVVEPLIGKAVEIPERLKSILVNDKKSIPMNKEFSTFKDWLMNQ
ncbi:MAG TPA: threonine synthase [Chitinophagales bacterium]|nr:threonine synthase [Chitinophagales bacterium]